MLQKGLDSLVIRRLPAAAGAILGTILLFSPPAAAQMQTTTAITGTVIDPTGAIVPNAIIGVKEQRTGASFETISNDSGVYAFPSLLPGVYTITVKKEGFETSVITDRSVLATQPATVDVEMRVGGSASLVTVSAEGAELVTTADQTITGTITPSLVRDLPDIKGNMFDLLLLAPGVFPQVSSSYNGGLGLSQTGNAYNYVNVGNTTNSSGVFVGGNRDSASNVSIDGSNVQDPVYQNTPQLQSTDSIQELRVQTANMNAEFGYGASGINIITKSGSNSYHGDVYEFVRNNHFDANSYFSNLNGQKLPNYEQNRFGGSVGGPIRKDRLFFFFNYEGLRSVQGQNVQITAVPANYAAGDFSVNPNSTAAKPLAAIPIYNPYSYDANTGLRSPFPGNKIPTNLMDPITVAFLQKWVLQPNGFVNNIPVFLGTQKSNIDSDQYTARVDFLHTSSSTIYGRYTYTPFQAFAGSVDPLAGTFNPWSSKNTVAHWIKSFSPITVNHFFVGYSRPRWFTGRKTDGIGDISGQLGIKNTSTLPGGPDFAGTGYDMDVSSVNLLNAVSNSYQLQDDISTIRGAHNLRAGISLMNKRFYYNAVQDDKGVFNFTGAYTQACPLGNAACAAAQSAGGLQTGGLGFADYLLGATSDGTTQGNFLILTPAPYEGRQLYTGVYFQDSWRISSKLTLNYGLRYEHWTPWLVPRNTTLTYDATTGNPQYALQNPLDYLSASACYGRCAPLNSNVPRTGYTTGGKDFAPRVGLAYAVTQSTIFRASFGIYYDGNVNDNQLSNLQTGAAPFSLRYQQSVQTRDYPVPTWTVSKMFPGVSPTSVPIPNNNPVDTYRFVERYLPTPAVDQWSADIQQRVGKTWALDVSYVGSHTTHEFQFIDVNSPALPQGAIANLSTQARRPFPAWGQLGTWAPIGWGRYNGLLVSFKNSNAWHGLTFLTNFSWGKEITSSHWGHSDIGNQNFRDPYVWAGAYTAVPPLRLVSGFSYQLPFGHGKDFGTALNPALDHIVGGWSVSGIATFASGGWAPILNLGPDTTGTGETAMPDLICNPNNVPGGRNRFEWWNPSCVVPAPFGTYGNANMAAFTLPGINNWNISFQKSTRIPFPRETGSIQFRVDMFNAFNHTQWASPTQYFTSPTSASNGVIGGTLQPRQMELAMKYTF